MSEVIPFRRGAIKPQELVLRFMDSIGHKSDAESYLRIFTAQKPESFAIIVIDEEVLAEDLDAVIFDLRYLAKLSLFPVVLIQASDNMLHRMEVESYFQKAKLAVSFLPDNLNLLEKMEFIQSRIKKNTLALLTVDTEANIFTEVATLAKTIKTKKVIFLKRAGGIQNIKTQTQISLINLRFDKDTLIGSNTLSQEDERLIQLSDELIHLCTHKIFVTFVSPINLLRELFTVKGSGTLIQQGSQIKSYSSWDEVNKDGLRILLQTSFEKKIKDNFMNRVVDRFYIEENFQGAALINKVKDLNYLSQFAVGTEARGLGIGRDLWAAVTENHKNIFWRSDPNRFITSWYVKQCDGMHKTPKWTVFWKGIEPKNITAAIEYALAQDEDFETNG